MSSAASAPSALPWPYTFFFLWIEPVATAAGTYYAYFAPQAYLALTEPSTAASLATTRETIVLAQLANMYLAFALLEAGVLRAADPRSPVWQVFLLCMLLADFGHLWSVQTVGWDIYYRVWDWNEMYWGNLGFVYVGASLRIAFLLGLGLGGSRKVKV